MQGEGLVDHYEVRVNQIGRGQIVLQQHAKKLTNLSLGGQPQAVVETKVLFGINRDRIEPIKLGPLAHKAIDELCGARIVKESVDLSCQHSRLSQISLVEFLVRGTTPEEVRKPDGEFTAVELPSMCLLGGWFFIEK